MAKTNGGEDKRGRKAASGKRIHLLGTVQLLEEYITPALCGAVFRKVRSKERQREWTLHALVEFWIAVILRAPASLTQALAAVREGHEPRVPQVKATPEAFFERCRNLRSKFFAEIFLRFIVVLEEKVPPRYCSHLAGLQERFPRVLVIDGSRCEETARRLKILWDERSVVLPGCLLGVSA